MSEFQFCCPFCKQELDCLEEMEGVEVECPVCKNKIIPNHIKDSGFVPLSGQIDFSEKNIHDLKKCDSIAKTACPDNKFFKYSMVALACVAFLLLICSLEFGLFPKDCRKNEPQVYVRAQYSMLNSLMITMDSFPSTANVVYYDFQKMVKVWSNSIYTAENYMQYAKQYLICEGKCCDHALKSKIINDALSAGTSFCLRLVSYENLLKIAAQLEEEARTIVSRAEFECRANEVRCRNAVLDKARDLRNATEKIVEAEISVKKCELGVKNTEAFLESVLRDHKRIAALYEDAQKEAKKRFEKYRNSALHREVKNELAEKKKDVDESNREIMHWKKKVEDSKKLLAIAKTSLRNAEKSRSDSEKAVKDAEKQLSETKKNSVKIIENAKQDADAIEIRCNKKKQEAKMLFVEIKNDFSVMKKKFDDAVLVINDVDEFKRKNHVRK